MRHTGLGQTRGVTSRGTTSDLQNSGASASHCTAHPPRRHAHRPCPQSIDPGRQSIVHDRPSQSGASSAGTQVEAWQQAPGAQSDACAQSWWASTGTISTRRRRMTRGDIPSRDGA